MNKGLDISEKKLRIVEKTKKIEDKTDKQLDLIRDQEYQEKKELNLINKSNLENRPEKLDIKEAKQAKQLIDEINKGIEDIQNKDFFCTHTNGKPFNFCRFTDLKLVWEIYSQW